MSDLDYINFIRKGDNGIIAKLYGKLRSSALKYLLKSKGLSRDDCQDIFQDSIVCLVTNARKDGFTLTCKLETYVIGICKNLASNKLRKSSKLTPLDQGEECFSIIDVATSDDDIELKMEKNEKVSLAKSIFRQIGDNCKKLLSAFYLDEMSYKQITETMGVYANEDSAKTAKNKCMTKIKSVASQINI